MILMETKSENTVDLIILLLEISEKTHEGLIVVDLKECEEYMLANGIALSQFYECFEIIKAIEDEKEKLFVFYDENMEYLIESKGVLA